MYPKAMNPKIVPVIAAIIKTVGKDRMLLMILWYKIQGSSYSFKTAAEGDLWAIAPCPA